MKGKSSIVLLLSFVAVFIMGCTRGDSKDNYYIYYLNESDNGIVSEGVYIDEDSMGANEIANTLIAKLAENPQNSKYGAVLKNDLKIRNKINVENGNIVIDFTDEFYDLDSKKKIIIESAVVKTLVQVKGCNSVSFTVGNKPLTYSDGTVVGKLSSDSFVENPGEKMSTTLKDDIVLYFSNKSGTGLVEEKRTVYYNSNLPIEKKVVEQLIEGPAKDGEIATLPTAAKVINVRVEEGVCYLNLDETIKNNQNNEVSEEVVLYSIVNSLTSIDGIDKVQIQINGNVSGKLRVNYSLSKMYKKNNSLVHSDEKKSEKTKEKEAK